jgi:hypothetical protein
MRIEIIKTKHGFRIPQLESMEIPERLFATLEGPSEIHPAPSQVTQTSSYQMIKNTVKEIGGDDLLEGILNRLPHDYHYISAGKSDDEILYEALKEKYEL